MKYDEAKLYLEHTSSDDFNLEEHQINNRLEAIKIVLEENEELKKQLQIKDYVFNVVNEEFCECAEENLKLLNRQLKFIKYLKDKEKQFDIIGDSINSGACCGILKKYKEIIKYEQN